MPRQMHERYQKNKIKETKKRGIPGITMFPCCRNKQSLRKSKRASCWGCLSPNRVDHLVAEMPPPNSSCQSCDVSFRRLCRWYALFVW